MLNVEQAVSPEVARTIWQHLLPQIEASRQVTRLLIQNFPADKLDVCPVPNGESFGDMLWYLTSVFDTCLIGICDGQIGDLPIKPQPQSSAAFLAWADEQHSKTLHRLESLSDEDLLKPITFAGITEPALNFAWALPSNVSQHMGMLGAYLHTQGVSTSATESDELTESELAGVSGGTTISIQDIPGSSMMNVPPVNVNYVNPVGNVILNPEQTQTGLGCLLGSSASGYHAIGLSGAGGVLCAIFGVGVGSNALAYMSVGYGVGRAILMAAGILRV